jgi:hypothetical protein
MAGCCFRVGMLLECLIPEASDKHRGSIVRLEVLQRTAGHLQTITATLLGRKKYRLDLPGWIGELSPGVNPDCIKMRRTWMEEDLDPEVLRDPVVEIDRKVVHLWRREASSGPSASRVNEEYSIASAWLEGSLARAELDPVLAIMVLLILYRLGHLKVQTLATETGGREYWSRRLSYCRREALGLLRQLGRRALHSAHVEVLATSWLCSSGPRRSDDLARRLERLRTVLSPTIDRADAWLIRQFCRAAELRSSPDLASIALALRAALGDDVDPGALLGDAIVTTELIAIASVVPDTPGSSLADIPGVLIERLEKLMGYVQGSGVVMSLLDFLPDLDISRRGQLLKGKAHHA